MTSSQPADYLIGDVGPPSRGGTVTAFWPLSDTLTLGARPTAVVSAWLLRLRSDWKRIVIEVWDQSPRAPEARQPQPDAEDGRGLLLVDKLSERWGWDYVSGWSGKVAWAEISVG